MSPEAWSYDGSFEGLLALADRAIALDSAPCLVRSEARAEGGLFGEAEPAVREGTAAGPARDREEAAGGPARDREEAAGDAAARILALSRRLYAAAARAWMSEEAVEPELLFAAVQVGRRGEAALGDFSMPELRALAASVRRVTREIHRLEGFARFSLDPGGRYVALLEPDHNVLPALAPFFARRFGGEPFALVDLRRGAALVSRDGRMEARFGEEALALARSAAEGEDEALWRRYFAATENPLRRNPRLQRQLLPERYWRHVTEMRASAPRGLGAGLEPDAGAEGQ